MNLDVVSTGAARMRERQAAADGFYAHREGETLEEMLAKRYPLLMMSQPRVVRDPERGEWKFDQGKFWYRCGLFGGLGGIFGNDSAEWREAQGGIETKVTDLTAEDLLHMEARARMMRELLQAPSETVPAP